MPKRTLEEITATLKELKSFSKDLPAVIEEKPVKKEKVKKGRPIAITPQVIAKIQEVAALDGSVEEMASYAGVGVRTLYDYLKDNEGFS
jgi:hypothetical protein